MNRLNHIAVVMDGNRRWARKNNFLDKLGYSQGLKTIETLLRVCVEEKISNLSLFAFSTENWARPKDEVEFIFHLFEKVLDESLHRFIENNIRLRFIGDLERLDLNLRKKLKNAENSTQNCTLLCVLSLIHI